MGTGGEVHQLRAAGLPHAAVDAPLAGGGRQVHLQAAGSGHRSKQKFALAVEIGALNHDLSEVIDAAGFGQHDSRNINRIWLVK